MKSRQQIKIARYAAIFTLAGIFLILATPAHANVPIGWGLQVVRAPLTIAEGTRGLAALIIIVLEGLILGTIPKVGWLKGLLLAAGLNFASSVLGFIPGVFMFSAGSWVFIGIFLIPFLTSAILKSKGAPRWYITVAIVTFLIGTINTVIVAGFSDPYSSRGMLILIELSLLYFFSFTITCEGYIFGSIYREKPNWKRLFIANVASYLVLAFMFPYFAPNPAGGYQLRSKVKQMIAEGDHQKAVDTIRWRRSNAQFLLGLQEVNTPPPDYSADFEISLLTYGSEQATETGLAISEDTLTVPTLTPEAREKLEWLQGFFTHWLACEDAIKSGNQDLLDLEIMSWLKWDEENIYPDERKNNRYSGWWTRDPVEITLGLLDEYESELTLPEIITESDLPFDDTFGVLGGEDEISTSQ